MESPNTHLYPRFSDVEIERRRALVGEFMEERELDGLVVFGWSAQNRTAQADVYYLSGYLGMRDNYVVLSAEGRDDTLRPELQPRPKRNRGLLSRRCEMGWGRQRRDGW